MKKFFKYLLLTALFILLPTVTAFAEEKEVYKRRDGLSGPGQITINRPVNTAWWRDYEFNNTYTLYKLFDATVGPNDSITYKLADGMETVPAAGTLSKFDVDSTGQVHYYTRETEEGEWTINQTAASLNDEDIANIRAYIHSADSATEYAADGSAD